MKHLVAAICLTTITLSTLAPSAYAAGCADISGKYESTSKVIGKRFLTIQQKSCELFEVTLDNGYPGKPETVWANNQPYTYFAHDKSGNGAEVPNGQPISTSLKDRYKMAQFIGASLKMMDVTGWHVSTDICKPQIVYQPQCSVTEVIYSLKDANTLIETQNGYTYVQGNMIPTSIEYARVK